MASSVTRYGWPEATAAFLIGRMWASEMPEDLRLDPLSPGSDIPQELESHDIVLVVVEDFVHLALAAGPDLTSHDVAVVD